MKHHHKPVVDFRVFKNLLVNYLKDLLFGHNDVTLLRLFHVVLCLIFKRPS